MTVLKCKIRYKRIIIFLFILFLLILIVFNFLNLRITNIYVDGNHYLSDQDIIELAHLENYPRVMTVFSKSLESKITSSKLVESTIVKKNFSKVFISVVENRPLFYDEKNKKTVLKNGDYVSDLYNVPLLSSTVSSDIYDKFLNKLSLIDFTSFNSISEIAYTPNSVDNELFLFSMNDGNYIYVNLDKFESVNRYLEMIVKFNNHKGILYLDSGEYFKFLDN